MTKLVEFIRAMAPFQVGDTRAMPDDLADKIIESGDGVEKASVFSAAAKGPKKYFGRGKGAAGAF